MTARQVASIVLVIDEHGRFVFLEQTCTCNRQRPRSCTSGSPWSDLEIRKYLERSDRRIFVLTVDAVSILPFIVTPRNPGVRRRIYWVTLHHAGMRETRRSADCRLPNDEWEKEVWEYGRLGGRENRRNAQCSILNVQFSREEERKGERSTFNPSSRVRYAVAGTQRSTLNEGRKRKFWR